MLVKDRVSCQNGDLSQYCSKHEWSCYCCWRQLAALSLGVLPELGWFYFVPVFSMTLMLVIQNARLIVYPEVIEARKMFHGSNIYLAAIILLICVNITFV